MKCNVLFAADVACQTACVPDAKYICMHVICMMHTYVSVRIVYHHARRTSDQCVLTGTKRHTHKHGAE